MQELIITENEAGQRFDKYLLKYLDKAPSSFIYKMLRKKNITLNGGRAEGSEKLKSKDRVKFFLSDETINKFKNDATDEKCLKDLCRGYDIAKDIIYEDENVLFINKPAGTLSQKASASDISMNEYILDYLLKSGGISRDSLRAFKPSVCNRLDRNTSGLITCGKSLMGLQELSSLFKNRTADKYYIAVAVGKIKTGAVIEGYLKKDEKENIVKIVRGEKAKDYGEPDRIKTEYMPLSEGNMEGHEYTVLRIKLITGKTHQIRAQLSYIGHPLIGDGKYGDKAENCFYRQAMGIKSQLLHSYELKLNGVEGGLSYLNGKSFFAEPPKIYESFGIALGGNNK